jgi:hypothetical protein
VSVAHSEALLPSTAHSACNVTATRDRGSSKTVGYKLDCGGAGHVADGTGFLNARDDMFWAERFSASRASGLHISEYRVEAFVIAIVREAPYEVEVPCWHRTFVCAFHDAAPMSARAQQVEYRMSFHDASPPSNTVKDEHG